MRLTGAGNEGNRNFFIFDKDNSFQSLFAVFLVNCGFEPGSYENREDICKRKNLVEHFKNDRYDIDVVYTENRIILIVRTELKEELNKGIEKMIN